MGILSFFTQNLWRDEAYSALLIQKDITSITKLTAGDFSPPLYYYLLKFWTILFGTSEIALRSFSLLAYVLLLFVLFEIIYVIFRIPLKRSIFYFFLFVLNPFLITYAFEARMYMLGTFFTTTSFFFLWKGKKIQYLLCITLALYTHYFTFLIYAGQLVGKLLYLYPQFKKRNLSYIANEITSFLIPLGIFFPWIVFMILTQQESPNNFWILTPIAKQFWYIPFTLYSGYETVFGTYFHEGMMYISTHNFLNLLLVVMIFIPLLAVLKSHKKFSFIISHETYIHLIIWSLFAPFFLFFISFLWQPLYLPRYFIFSCPGLLLLLVVHIEWAYNSLFKSSLVRTVFFICISCMCFVFTHKYNNLNLIYHRKRNVDRMYTAIAAKMRPKDAVYVTDVLDYHLALFYLPRNTNIKIYKKTYAETPRYVGKVLMPPSAFVQMLPVFPARAFVVYYDYFETRTTL